MAITNLLLLSQIAGYVIALVLALLCIIVPMGMHVRDFKGHCLLFSTGTWQESDGQLDVKWASISYCNYVIVVGVLLLIVSIVQIYRLTMLLRRGADSSFISAFIDVLTSILLSAFIIIAAISVTLGFMTWCENIMERFPSCDVAAGLDFDKKDNISTSYFYVEIGTAQFGTWAALSTCVGLSVFALLKLCRYHQLENIRVSMYRERQRLVNDGGSPTDSLRREYQRAPTPPITEDI